MDAIDERADRVAACTDVAATIEAVAFWSHEMAAARCVCIEVDPHPRAARVAADASELTLIVSPLLDNAIKFTRPEATVHVGYMQPARGRVRVTVTDEALWVKPEDCERIFAEFDRGSADPLVAKPTGLGLGLSIVRRLARRLGDDVEIEPSAPNRGRRAVG